MEGKLSMLIVVKSLIQGNHLSVNALDKVCLLLHDLKIPPCGVSLFCDLEFYSIE